MIWMEIEMTNVTINRKGVMQLAWDFYGRWSAEMSFGECLARAWLSAKVMRSEIVFFGKQSYASDYDLLNGAPRKVYVPYGALNWVAEHGAE